MPHPVMGDHGAEGQGGAERQGRGSRATVDSMQQVASAWMHSQHRVLAYLLASVSDFHEAEDLLQEVAAVVLSGHEKFDPDRSFTAWCIGIAKNLVRAHYRKKSHLAMNCDEGLLETLADAAARVEDQLTDRQHALRECISRLPEEKARVLRMRYEQDLDPDEIGRLLGRSKPSVVVMLHRVRRTLANCVSTRLRRFA